MCAEEDARVGAFFHAKWKEFDFEKAPADYGAGRLIAPQVPFRPSLSRLTRPSKVSALAGKNPTVYIQSDYQKDALGSRCSLLSPLFDNAFQVCAYEALFLLLASVL